MAFLARGLHVSPATVSNWVSRRRRVPMSKALAIEVYTGVKVVRLRPDLKKVLHAL